MNNSQPLIFMLTAVSAHPVTDVQQARVKAYAMLQLCDQIDPPKAATQAKATETTTLEAEE